MGWLRKSLFVIGIVLIVFPLLAIIASLNLIPQNPNLGFISNNILFLVAGIIILIFVFLSWNREKKKKKAINTETPIGGQRQQIPSHALRRAEAEEKERRRKQEREAIRKDHVMEMKAVGKRYSAA